MMNQIREREADINARSQQERVAAELRRKEAQELDEIKAYVREYSFSINELLQSSQKLLVFLRKLSNLKGTKYLSEMRAFDLGITSCTGSNAKIKCTHFGKVFCTFQIRKLSQKNK